MVEAAPALGDQKTIPTHVVTLASSLPHGCVNQNQVGKMVITGHFFKFTKLKEVKSFALSTFPMAMH